MNPEPTTTAGRSAEHLRRLLAEKDARLRQQRQRALPQWLATRTSRRAIALLPALPLACGLYAGTRPDTTLGTALTAGAAVFSVAAILLLRLSTRLLDAVPDRLLDEREIGERNDAYRRAHLVVVALFALLAGLAAVDGARLKLTGAELFPGDGWLPVTMTAMLASTMIPAAVVAWRWAEPADDPED